MPDPGPDPMELDFWKEGSTWYVQVHNPLKVGTKTNAAHLSPPDAGASVVVGRFRL